MAVMTFKRIIRVLETESKDLKSLLKHVEIRKKKKERRFSELGAINSVWSSNTPIKSDLLFKYSHKFYCLNFHNVVLLTNS